MDKLLWNAAEEIDFINRQNNRSATRFSLWLTKRYFIRGLCGPKPLWTFPIEMALLKISPTRWASVEVWSHSYLIPPFMEPLAKLIAQIAGVDLQEGLS